MPDKYAVRFFVYNSEANDLEVCDPNEQGDIVECDEATFLEDKNPISYERHTVFDNGVSQICLTKMPRGWTMTAQYTRGEWIAKGTEVYCGPHKIASTAWDSNGLDAAQDKSNARLIAAAPKLLEALEHAAPLVLDFLERYLTDIDAKNIFGRVQAAIAAAKGE